MGFLICAGILLLIIFGFSFYSYSFSLDERNAAASKSILIITGILGVLLVCLSGALFFALLAGVKAEGAVKDVIIDSFVQFAVSDIVIVAAGLAITFISSVMKSFLRPVIPIVLPMWGIITLFWTAVCCVWSDFKVFSASAFVILFGIGASLLLSFAALPQMHERIRALTDQESRSEIIKNLSEKRAKKQSRRIERKRLSEQKKRLKHPKRK